MFPGGVCVHSAMTGSRLAAPLLALQLGYSAAAVGVLLALFALAWIAELETLRDALKALPLTVKLMTRHRAG